jgi:hypothetical protein
MRTYQYVGPRNLLELANADVARCEPRNPADLLNWLSTHSLSPPVTLTFVVTVQGQLRVSPRHAEHVACARAEPVRAAGELELGLSAGLPSVLGITNQSTGYCPEPACFPEVVAALGRAGFRAPGALAHEFLFRRCPKCRGISIVKEDEFECASCGGALPETWNFDEPESP